MILIPIIFVVSLVLTTGLVPSSQHEGGTFTAPDEGSRPAQSQMRLELNIPAYRLDVIVDGHVTSSYTVAVGMLRYPTPVRDYRITEIVWNPWWYPPPSDWARDEQPMPPGPDNPMGRVKLQASQYIFIHGTPAVTSLGQAASHGCIRMSSEDAMQLARQVVGYGAPGITAADIDVLEANPRRTRAVPLDLPIAFRAAYRVAEVRYGMLELYPDVYGRVRDRWGEATRALAEAGIGPERVDRSRLEELLLKARREHVAVPVDSVIVVGAEEVSASRPSVERAGAGSSADGLRADVVRASRASIEAPGQEGC